MLYDRDGTCQISGHHMSKPWMAAAEVLQLLTVQMPLNRHGITNIQPPCLQLLTAAAAIVNMEVPVLQLPMLLLLLLLSLHFQSQ